MENAAGLGMPSTGRQALSPGRRQKNIPGKQAYSLNGTPADCVNLAVGNLARPQARMSRSAGINLGYNVTHAQDSFFRHGGGSDGSVPCLGCEAMAVSLALPNEEFGRQIRDSGGKVKGKMDETLKVVAESATKYAVAICAAPVPEGLSVHNLNYPSQYDGKEDPILTFANPLKSIVYSINQHKKNAIN